MSTIACNASGLADALVVERSGSFPGVVVGTRRSARRFALIGVLMGRPMRAKARIRYWVSRQPTTSTRTLRARS